MRIKEICDLQNGRAFKPSEWETEGLPIVRIQNLNDENAPFNYYSGDYNPVHEINNGELLFSWSGTPGTSFGAFRWYRGKGILNQHIFRVIPKIQIDKNYLMYALNGNLASIIAKAHGGVGLQHITKKELDLIEVPVVSIDKQLEIVSTLDKLQSIIWTAIYSDISLRINLIKTVVTSVCTAIWTVISTVWRTIHDFISPLLEAFRYLFETIFMAIYIIISRVMERLLRREGFRAVGDDPLPFT